MKTKKTTKGKKEAHETMPNWCCACDYDRVKVESRFASERSRIKRELLKYKCGDHKKLLKILDEK
jgi:hypothetical protein